MSERFFEDLKQGDRFKSEIYRVTEEQIISFAREFDPQPFHLDATVADKTMFGGLIASGWHTAAITMRLFVKSLNFAEGAIGLGVDELRWPNAVKPGDELCHERTFLRRLEGWRSIQIRDLPGERRANHFLRARV